MSNEMINSKVSSTGFKGLVRCDNCKHAVFDAMFGEWKCRVYQRQIVEMNGVDNVFEMDCMDFHSGKPGLSDRLISIEDEE